MSDPSLGTTSSSTSPPRRRRRSAVVVSAVALLVLSGLNVLLPGVAGAQTLSTTVVSLTFDDGNADQMTPAATLAANGMKGTFYIPSGFVGAPNYMTLANLNTLKAQGHEIGGHSVTHPDLTTLPNAEAKRQICNDRVNLSNWGFPVTSFAYPFAAATTTTENLANQCGYRSARGLGDIQSRFGCTGCPYAETLTNQPDKFYTRALDQVDKTWTLQDLQTAVTNAETNGGGWVQITFHHFDGADDLSISNTIFNQFVGWLTTRPATTTVKPVNQVITGAPKALVSGAVVNPPGPGVNGAKNASLETDGGNGFPQCWMAGGYGQNTPTFTTTTNSANAKAGTKAENVSVSGYVDGDAKLLPTFDLGGCSPSVTAGKTYSMRAWYKAETVTQYAVYTRSGIGTWSYWTSSPWFAASPTYVQAVWTTPAIPAGVTGISFGLSQFNNGLLTTDSYAFYDTVGAPAAATTQVPAAALAANRAAATASATATPEAGTSLLAKTVPPPPNATKRVTTNSKVYDPTVPTGPAAHRNRDQRRGPAANQPVYVPGPNQVAPGTPIAVGEGALSG